MNTHINAVRDWTYKTAYLLFFAARSGVEGNSRPEWSLPYALFAYSVYWMRSMEFPFVCFISDTACQISIKFGIVVNVKTCRS
jgi:hypothetical protein